MASCHDRQAAARVPGLAIALLVAAAATLHSGAPQDKPLQLKSGIAMVRLDVVVLDDRGKVVTGLTESDLVVREDGKPQAIARFVPIDERVERTPAARLVRAGVSDVASNEGFEKGRIFVIVLDDRQTLEGREERVKEAATRLIEQLGPDDLVAIASTSGRATGVREFTRDRASLLAAIDGFRGLKNKSDRLDPLDLSENPFKYRSHLESLETLRRIASYLAPLADRKTVIVYIGEGFELDLHDERKDAGAPTGIGLAAEIVQSARRANTTLYAIDPRGPGGLFDEGSIGLQCDEDYGKPWTNRARIGRESLISLADKTGGYAAVNVADFSAAADQIVRETASYYLVGYYPEDQSHPQRFRHVTVEARRKGLYVRARQGYWPEPVKAAGHAAPPRPIEAALTGILPATEIPLRLSSASFKSPASSRASVVVVLSVGCPSTSGSPCAADTGDRLELRLLAADSSGHVRDAQTRVVAPRGRWSSSQVPFLLHLPPGAYVLRAAAEDTLHHVAGGVSADLLVPKFSSSLALSGLVLGSRESATAGGLPAGMGEVVPFPPTNRRRFGRGEELSAFVRAYQPPGSSPVDVLVEVSAVASDGVATTLARREIAGGTFVAGGGQVACLMALPLARLAAGDYRLVVEARSRAAVDPPVRQEIPIAVIEATLTGQ